MGIAVVTPIDKVIKVIQESFAVFAWPFL